MRRREQINCLAIWLYILYNSIYRRYSALAVMGTMWKVNYTSRVFFIYCSPIWYKARKTPYCNSSAALLGGTVCVCVRLKFYCVLSNLMFAANATRRRRRAFLLYRFHQPYMYSSNRRWHVVLYTVQFLIYYICPYKSLHSALFVRMHATGVRKMFKFASFFLFISHELTIHFS